MISSLIFLSLFLFCSPISISRRSGARIMTPNGESPNTLPSPNFVPFTQINESIMLTQPASNPPAPPPITTGIVIPTTSTLLTPVQVVNSPVISMINESFMLTGTSSNPPMAPASPSPITTGTVISTSIVPIVDESLMLGSSTLQGSTISGSNIVTIVPPPINIDLASMLTGTVTPADINTVTPAPLDTATYVIYINESFIIQSPDGNAATTASPISVTFPSSTTVPPYTIPIFSDTTPRSTPNIVPVTTGFPTPASSHASGTIVPLSGASASSSETMTDPTTNELPETSTPRNENMQIVYPDAAPDGVSLDSIKMLNASVVGPMLGVVIPTEIKIYLNITSNPSISVHISTDPPVTEITDDTVVVEVIHGNDRLNISSQDGSSVSINLGTDPPVTEVTEEAVEIIEGNGNISMTSQSQDMISRTSIENTFSEVPIYIDLSNSNRPDVDFGSTTPKPLITTQAPPVQTTTRAPGTVPPVVRRKFEEKCLEYYNIGKRTTRRTKVQVFIIGGDNSGEKEFPHMAALGYGKENQQQWLCGGSLISVNYVITAAHCLSARSLGEIRYVRLGTTTLQTETLNSEDFNVIRRIPYPGYVQGKQYNDIALLQLDRPVNFSDYIAPICLSDFRDFTNAKLTATGWGKIEEEGSSSPELRKVGLEYFPNDVCRRAYDGISTNDLPGGISEETQICAGAVDGTRDTCQGDSGGPLQVQQNGRMYLVGITSFGIGCGRVDSPGVYTRVSYYIPWIESIVW